jgi:hypothetical protein
MKIYIVASSETDWDEYFSIVVVAESKERALEIAIEGNQWKAYEDDPDWLEKYSDEFWEYRKNKKPIEYPKGTVFWKFEKHQYPLKVTEINLEKEQVINSSYIGS